MSGEKLGTNPWNTLWGVRLWQDEEEKCQWGSEEMEEIYQVMRAAMIVAVHEAHGRRKKGSTVKQWKAHQIYQRAQTLVQSMID